MIKQTELKVIPSLISDHSAIRKIAAENLKVGTEDIKAVIPLRRSIDARSREPHYNILANIFINEFPDDIKPVIRYEKTRPGRRVVIVGSGPAGMFAALKLIEEGVTPVILERGKDVRLRRRDLRAIQQEGTVDPDSNYCFGEGGAGTYSDGKLYTRSTKRGDIKKILGIFVQHGAVEEILIDAHPHIGSNKLPEVVQAMRNTILACGGEIHFQSRVTDFILEDRVIKGVVINGEKEVTGEAVILATGHSAMDIYELCHKHGIILEAKPFAMGVRIEHPQAVIDEIQYHRKDRGEYLPAASYSLTCQVNERGVFSFCMCPGGIIIPASTAPGELVLNGMSVSRRDSLYANSGFVASINENDWAAYRGNGVFAGLDFQRSVEKAAFEAGGRTQKAPAQRITDFVEKRISKDLPKGSYIPGTVSAPLHDILPKAIAVSLREALLLFQKKMKGYYTREAQILAAETRTSSPLRIPRDRETYQHINTAGLFPCGEGAGYAGGIVSAAIDGENSASAVLKYINA